MKSPRRAKSREAACRQQPLISFPLRLRIQVACCSMPAGAQIFSDRYSDRGFFVAWLSSTPTRLVSPVL